MNRLMCVLLFSVLLTGCSRSAQNAQKLFDEGMRSQIDVREAFFVKAWGLNAALSTEARQKWELAAKLTVVENSQDGKIEADDAKIIVENFSAELGKDEITITENFAYLAFLLTAGERSDQFLNQVDVFIESKKPIWRHLSHQSRQSIYELMDDIKMWLPLISNLKQIIPEPLINLFEKKNVPNAGV